MPAAGAPAAPGAAAAAGQIGGMRPTAMDEVRVMSGHFILIGLVLLSVYVSRIPQSTLLLFKRTPYQLLGLFAVIALTATYGWIHGILAALAFSLVVSRALRVPAAYEGMTDYIIPAGLIMEGDSTSTEIIPRGHRWFLEKVMGEKPLLIRDKEVRTTAVQDLSERSMGFSSTTR